MKDHFPKHIFVTGIGTGVGKTIVAAILTEALQADYWKPVQTGTCEDCDSDTLRSLIRNSISVIHPETYRFKYPSSPHYAANLEGKNIDLKQLRIPRTTNRMVIEGAGGLMVPLNQQKTMLDLIAYLKVRVVLVAQEYLGGINHTLLSLDAMERWGISCLGIVFNGEPFLDNEEIIQTFSGVRVLARIPKVERVDKLFIREQAKMVKQELIKYFDGL